MPASDLGVLEPLRRNPRSNQPNQSPREAAVLWSGYASSGSATFLRHRGWRSPSGWLDADADELLDLSAVPFIDSSGLKAIVTAGRMAGSRGRNLTLHPVMATIVAGL